jgi:serine phosphatase RsbU (regulator of sigma subunit)
LSRLILIEGPQSGEFFKLRGKNYLGKDDIQLTFSYSQKLKEKKAFISRTADDYKITNLDPNEELLVNGESVDNAYLNHGDIITVCESVMIFDCDTPEESTGYSPHPVEAKPPDSVRIGSVKADESHDLSASATLDQATGETHIRYRQKHYEDPSSVVERLKDPRILTHRLATLLKVSSAIGLILDVQNLLNKLLDLIFDEIPSDRGAILLFEKKERKLRTMASRIREGRPPERVKISRTIVKEVLRSKESLLTFDAMSDDRFSLGLSIVNQNIRSAMCVPLVRKDKLLGIIFVDTCEETRAFTNDDLDLLTGIAMQATLAIENIRLYREVWEKEKIKYELNLASSIQKELLPKKLPKFQGIEVYGKMIPAKEVGGDYFDFISHPESNSLHILIGDVSGKGVGAGLVMAIARSYFRTLTLAYSSPKKILSEANRFLFEDTKREMFMSALLLYWNEAEERLIYSGAGHEHLIIYRGADQRCEAIRAGGIALSLMRDAESRFHEREIRLDPGDAILLYTDGITEARNRTGEVFQLDNLVRIAEKYGHLGAKEILEATLIEVKNFIGEAEQHDDITIVTIKRK